MFPGSETDDSVWLLFSCKCLYLCFDFLTPYTQFHEILSTIQPIWHFLFWTLTVCIVGLQLYNLIHKTSVDIAMSCRPSFWEACTLSNGHGKVLGSFPSWVQLPKPHCVQMNIINIQQRTKTKQNKKYAFIMNAPIYLNSPMILWC